MADSTYQLIAIIIYLLGMIAIGYYGYKKTDDLDDYMLGGRRLSALTSALSAGASDMSQWLLMGLPGALYVAGLVEAWIAIGLTIGQYLNWMFVAPRLRTYTQVSNNSITIPSFFDNRFKKNAKMLRIISGIIIFIFFSVYVSSGLVAGGVFFESAFGYPYYVGLLVVGLVTIAYTFIGGFLAVSYTDVVQGTMMFLTLLLVPILTLFAIGGVGEATAIIRSAKPEMLSLFATASAPVVISNLAWGLGYFGQPHIIVRFMAIKSVKETTKARRIGIGWMILSLGGAIVTGLLGFAYLGDSLENAETVFIVLGQTFFHPFIAGFMLAAILAAIMSTVSSQLLVTSSALIEDIYKAVLKTDASEKQLVLLSRLAVLAVSIVAMILAWQQNDTILGIVAYAWAGFGAAFGPIILLSLYWRKLTGLGALWGMITGAATVLIWANTPIKEAFFNLYEIVPGFLLCLIVAVVVSLITYEPNEEIDREFDEAVRLAKERK